MLELLLTQKLDQREQLEDVGSELIHQSTTTARKGSFSTKNLKIWKTPVETVAKELALIEFEIFKSIKNYEFAEGGWKRKDGDKLAPNLLKSIRRFNVVSSWVATEIIQAKKSSSRIKRVQQAILLAKVKKHSHYCFLL